jgi:hypothetical protein
MVAQIEIPRPRGAEFEENSIGQRSHLVELDVNDLAKSVAAFYSYPGVARTRLPGKLSNRNTKTNALFISTPAGELQSRSNASHIINKPSNTCDAISCHRQRRLYPEFPQIDQAKGHRNLDPDIREARTAGRKPYRRDHDSC